MPRGGFRPGAGRKKVDNAARAEKIMAELLIPAFNEAGVAGGIRLGAEDIRLAYGLQGLREWKTWFEEVKVGTGFTKGGVKSEWRLKLKMAVAAKRLVKGEDHIPQFPPGAILEVLNKQAYKAFCREYKKHSLEIGKEYGTSYHPLPPYSPDRNYRKITHVVKDDGPTREMTDQLKSYAELLVPGIRADRSESSMNAIDIPESDVPY